MLEGIVAGQYIPGSSMLHRLDPRSKLIGTSLLVASTFLAGNRLWLGIVTVVAVSALRLGSISFGVAWQNLRAFWFVLAVSAVVQALFVPGQPVVGFGPIFITREGLVAGLELCWRLVCAVLLTAALTSTTTPLSLAAGLELLLRPLGRLGFPVSEMAMMLTVAVRFVPTLFEEAQTIIKAQRSRGGLNVRGKPFAAVAALAPLLVPLFVGTMRRADELARAMDARCYRGGTGRSRMNPLRLQRADFAVLVLCSLIFAGSILNCLLGKV